MTLRAHGKSWNEFSRWCQARGLKPLPAHAWTVASYVRWCETRQDYPDIVATVKSIARRHLITGHADPERNPMVRSTLAMIERRIASRHQRSSLFDDDNFKEEEPDGPAEDIEMTEPVETKAPSKRVYKSMRATPKLVRRRR